MNTWAVGDIQGCFQAFKRLLTHIQFDPDHDVLWSVGDLINRGSDNLSTLRWFYHHRHAVKVVLGNHDLHLLATWAGAGRKHPSDNFQDILEAPDAELLLNWLQHRPLLHQEGSDILVHAGIPPCWSSEEALQYSQEVEAVLQSRDSTSFFKTMYGNEPFRWSPHLRGLPRLRVITNYLTRMRFCTPSAALDLKSKGLTPKSLTLAGETVKPWFQHPSRLVPSERVLFGHWAALNGETKSQQFVGLDTGCVWGNKLTAYNLATQEHVFADA